MNSDLNNIIERIDQLKAEVDSYRPLKPEQENRLIQKLKLDWNFHSSHIEGNSLTYSETKSFLYWHITSEGKPFRDYLEMRGHNEAVEYLMDVLKGEEIELTEHLIRFLHQTILQEEYEADAITLEGKMIKRKIKPGQYKSMPNQVNTKSGEMFYFASPEETPSQMTDLMIWLHEKLNNKENHPLIIASLFHYKFVRIHPFDDGNGRMARLLMNLILMKFGYPPVIVPFGTKDDYYNALQFADKEDFDKFIIFIGERLIESLNLVLKVGKNEPIEEIEDIDKMVNALKAKVNWNELDKDITTEVTEDLIKELFTNSFKNLFEKFFDNLIKFDNFFVKRTTAVGINGVNLNLSKSNQFVDVILNQWQKHKLTKNISASIQFEYLIGDNSVSMKCDLVIFLEQFYYQVHSKFSGNTFSLKHRYHQYLTDEEMNDIVIQISKVLFEKINLAIENKNKSLK